MNAPQVENMRSSNGNQVPNQFRIITDEGVYFQSYSTMIAFVPRDGSTPTLDARKWDYSTTTSKYRNLFMHMDTKETKRRIKGGSIILANLN